MTPRISILLRLCAFLLVTCYGLPSFAASMTVCPKWVYRFTDSGQGEDGLLNNAGGGTYGEQPAAYTRGWITKDGVTLASGYLNSSGCFAPVTKTAGTYTVKLQPLVVRTDGAVFDVRRYDSGAIEQPTTTIFLSAGGGSDITRSVLFGSTADTVSNTMAVAIQFALESHIGLASTTHVEIIADSNFGTGVPVSDLQHVNLGHSTDGSKHALWKFSTAHEIGHTIQNALFGKLGHIYSTNSTVAVCACDHIDEEAEQGHCLQSHEQGAAAQQEGWAQFIALDAMNNDSQTTDGSFVYYKEFLWPSTGYPVSGEQLPPLKIEGRLKYKWLKTQCPAAGYVGTELDWMGFYFAVHTTTANNFFFTQFRDTYRRACGGGMCSDLTPSWANLQDATVALYGFNSPRANHWNTQGLQYGVNQ